MPEHPSLTWAPSWPVQISDKYGPVTKDGKIVGQCATAAYTRQAVEGALERLQVDCIDLFTLRSTDPHTPVEETVSLQLVSKVFCFIVVGTSCLQRCSCTHAHFVFAELSALVPDVRLLRRSYSQHARKGVQLFRLCFPPGSYIQLLDSHLCSAKLHQETKSLLLIQLRWL